MSWCLYALVQKSQSTEHHCSTSRIHRWPKQISPAREAMSKAGYKKADIKEESTYLHELCM